MELVSNSNSVLCAVTYVHLAPVCGTVITKAEGQMDHRELDWTLKFRQMSLV